MLQCNVMLTLLHIIYAYMVTFTLFICLIQIQRYVPYILQISQKIQRYAFLLIVPSTTLKKRAFGNILLDSPSCGLRREAKSFFFFLTEFMPFKFDY